MSSMRKLQAFDPCPATDCGKGLLPVSDLVLRCPDGHEHTMKTRCCVRGCRRVATEMLFGDPWCAPCLAGQPVDHSA